MQTFFLTRNHTVMSFAYKMPIIFGSHRILFQDWNRLLKPEIRPFYVCPDLKSLAETKWIPMEKTIWTIQDSFWVISSRILFLQYMLTLWAVSVWNLSFGIRPGESSRRPVGPTSIRNKMLLSKSREVFKSMYTEKECQLNVKWLKQIAFQY